MKSIRGEIIITILWFIADMLWMWDQVWLSLAFCLCLYVLISIASAEADEKFRFIYSVTLSWLMMNTLWMMTDLFDDQLAVISGKIGATLFGCIGLIILLKNLYKNEFSKTS